MPLFTTWRALFPYGRLRRGQAEMMDYVRQCLVEGKHVAIEAQNGWGKTVTSLSAALSSNRDRVIICTRTHEQVNHIVEEVRAINRRGHEFRCTVLGAKWRLCINPWLRGYQEIACAEFRTKEGNDYLCSFDDMREEDGIDLLLPVKMPRDVPKILDIGEAREVGFYDRMCPYYLVRVALEVSDIIVTPYNFVFSLPQRKSLGLNTSSSVIIVDEAHNLPSACRSLNSASISAEDIRVFIGQARGAADREVLLQLVHFRNWLRDFPDNASQELRERLRNGFVYGRDLLSEISANGIDRRGMLRALGIMVEGNDAPAGLYSFISLLFLTDPDKGVAYVSDNRLSYTVLDIRDNIADITQQNSVFLFMSGTLSPIEPFMSEVGLDLEYRAFGNIIPRERFQVELVGEREGEVVMSTQFENRHKEDTLLAYGTFILDTIAHIPNGSIIMFPSYEFKANALTNWHIHEIVRESEGLFFSNGIRIYDEGRTRNDLRLYKKDAKKKQTALMCVFRGKVTEGTDLPHELCRGIYVVGIPFAAWGSPVVRGLIDYYNTTRAEGSGEAWYMYDAITTVNQGIGRGIRDPDQDYCKVFLLDNRYIYRKAGIYNKLSDWIRRNVVNEDGSRDSDARERTEAFFSRLGQIP